MTCEGAYDQLHARPPQAAQSNAPSGNAVNEYAASVRDAAYGFLRPRAITSNSSVFGWQIAQKSPRKFVLIGVDAPLYSPPDDLLHALS